MLKIFHFPKQIMGCLLDKCGFKRSHETLEEEQPKVYSWDKRPKLDISNYMYDGLTDQTVGKLPGAINGQQFMVQNCKNCNIYLFDHTSTVTIDDCVDCNFFIGPIKTRFVRFVPRNMHKFCSGNIVQLEEHKIIPQQN
ncbi:protein XRP2-like [Mercenaria mercenaria]|uniref:protein XRP2-like n=1 Tax=Mercenaria mercenaria TaxID=6596 RepID=UPI00234EB18E|nr:protein XRP2-like [Mercenaria mercenaria]